MKRKISKVKSKKKAQKKKIFRDGKKWFWLVAGIILVLLTLMVALFYSRWQTTDKLNTIYKVVPLPVAIVGNSHQIINSKQLLEDFDSVKHFYQSKDFARQGKRIDFTTKQGQFRLQIKKKNILNKLIEDQVALNLTQKKGIKVTSEEVDEAIKKSLKESGGSYQELILNLQSSYGWSLDDFKNKVVKNQLYMKKLFQWYIKNFPSTKKYQKAQNIKEQIVYNKDGEDNFAEIAKQFSEGTSAKDGGELDWMSEEQIIPEVLVKIKDLKKGEISNIIVSPLGMHIVKVEDIRKVKNDKNKYQKEYQLRQIFIRGISFVDWLQKMKKEIPVKILVGKYKWDANQGEIVFSNEQLQKQEEKIKLESEGDPSI